MVWAVSVLCRVKGEKNNLRHLMCESLSDRITREKMAPLSFWCQHRGERDAGGQSQFLSRNYISFRQESISQSSLVFWSGEGCKTNVKCLWWRTLWKEQLSSDAFLRLFLPKSNLRNDYFFPSLLQLICASINVFAVLLLCVVKYSQWGFTITCKQHASSEHLSQYAAGRPHVYGLGVIIGGQEQAGGPIPFSDQTLGQITLEKRVGWIETNEKKKKYKFES